MASIQFSIPPLLARLFARKHLPASMFEQLVEQQAPDQAARVVYALRLNDPQLPLDTLVRRTAEAMDQPIGVVQRLQAVPVDGTTRLHLIRDSLERGDVEIGYRRRDRTTASSIITRDGKGSGRTLLEFGASE